MTTTARPATDAAPVGLRRSLVLTLAGLSAGAAVIHLAAAPGHFEEIGNLAVGFVASAIFQAAWIRWCLAGPSRTTMAIGIAGNLAIVVAWAWTRTVGLPLLGTTIGPEPVGFPDGASVVFELLLVAGIAARWFGLDIALGKIQGAARLSRIALIPAIATVLLTTSLATVALASGEAHGADDDHGAAIHAMEPGHDAMGNHSAP